MEHVRHLNSWTWELSLFILNGVTRGGGYTQGSLTGLGQRRNQATSSLMGFQVKIHGRMIGCMAGHGRPWHAMADQKKQKDAQGAISPLRVYMTRVSVQFL